MKMPQSIDTGSATVAWKMKAANQSPKRNGFLVLSADQNGTASVVAGSWIGSNKMTLFENSATWGNDLSKACKTGEELDCRLVINMDARSPEQELVCGEVPCVGTEDRTKSVICC